MLTGLISSGARLSDRLIFSSSVFLLDREIKDDVNEREHREQYNHAPDGLRACGGRSALSAPRRLEFGHMFPMLAFTSYIACGECIQKRQRSVLGLLVAHFEEFRCRT